MNTILITGAAGFIGRYVAQRYSDMGWHVVGLGRTRYTPEVYMEWGISDWLDTPLGQDSQLTLDSKPDLIVHCAGGSNVGYSLVEPNDDYRMSVGSLQRILEYIRNDAPNCSLVYLSSAAVYGAAKRLPIREADPVAPISVYGTNKLLCEQLVKAYSRHYGVKSAILRLFSVYGPGLRKQILWDACKKAESGVTDFFGTGTETRDFIHVADAVSLIQAAQLVASESSPVCNGGSGTPTRIKELVALVFKCFDDRLSPQFTERVRSGDPHDLLSDNSLALSWNWSPEVSLDSGIQGYVEWFQSISENQ